MVAIIVIGLLFVRGGSGAWPSALGDVGDAWRALLLGAPPALL